MSGSEFVVEQKLPASLQKTRFSVQIAELLTIQLEYCHIRDAETCYDAGLPNERPSTIGYIMTVASKDSTDNAIRTAAINQGFADASVVQHTARDQKDGLDKGTWFVLSIKRKSGDDWELLSRRRTEAELLTVIQNQRVTTN